MFTSQFSHISFTVIVSILLMLGGVVWLAIEEQFLIAALMTIPFIAMVYAYFSLAKIKGSMETSGHAVGQFIKGDMSARIVPGNHLDPFGMLQHRVNNLLDIVDLMVRDEESLIQPERDGDYYQKITQAPLMKMLQQERDAIEMSRIVPNLESGDDADEEDDDADEEEMITVPPRAAEKAAASAGVERFARKVDDLNLIANEIQSKLTQWHTSNQSVKAGDSQGLILSAETTRNNVEAVAAAAEELSYSIAQISQRMVDSDKIATQAVEHANKSNEIVKDLTSASEKIGTVVQMISDIAGQTNLLALNATIEAARAGEAGRGFAVVATEVKTLADQTSKATDDITRQIQGLQQSAKAAVRALEEIGKTIESMNEISGSISQSVQEQNVATNEISENIQTAAANTQDVVEGVSHISGGGVSAHSDVMKQLDDLSKQLLRELSALESNMKQEAA